MELDYCNSQYYNLSKSQVASNRVITVLLALWLKLLNLLTSHRSLDLCTGSRLMNALNINSSHSLTVFTTSQPDYLHNMISVQSTCRTHSSSVVTLASSSLQITNCFFGYASPYLWNQRPSLFRQPHPVHTPPVSPSRMYHLVTVPIFALPSITPLAFY